MLSELLMENESTRPVEVGGVQNLNTSRCERSAVLPERGEDDQSTSCLRGRIIKYAGLMVVCSALEAARKYSSVVRTVKIRGLARSLTSACPTCWGGWPFLGAGGKGPFGACEPLGCTQNGLARAHSLWASPGIGAVPAPVCGITPWPVVAVAGCGRLGFAGATPTRGYDLRLAASLSRPPAPAISCGGLWFRARSHMRKYPA